MMSTGHHLTAAVGLYLSLLASVVDARSLSIMVTNDDGFQAPGIVAVAAALRAAGYRVTVVAPRADQSGSSVKISLQPLPFKEESPGVWAVDGSPADAVNVGLGVILGKQPPDLVVSGTNRGQNLGSTSNLSGTVGAAIMAAIHDVPAIAVSAGIDFKEAKQGFPSTAAAYPEAAKFVVKMVAALAAEQGGPLLPTRTLLNVNYPALAQNEIKGARWTTVGPGSGYAISYQVDSTKGTAKLAFGPDTGREPVESNTDTARFAQGYITVSALQASWQSARTAEIAPRVSSLVAPETPGG